MADERAVNASSLPHSDESKAVIADVLSGVVQCLSIIGFGYVSGRLKLIGTTERRGLHVFVTCFAMPAAVFNSIGTVPLGDVHWKFLAAILLSKSVVFVLVSTFTLLLGGRPLPFGNAGLYAITTTQSNDLGFGETVISSLYGTTHPMFSHYIFLIFTSQHAFLNLFGFLLMEHHQKKSCDSETSVVKTLLLTVVRIFRNPLVIAPLLAVAWNVATAGSDPPCVLRNIIDPLRKAFLPTTLYLLGLNTAGKLGAMDKYDVLTTALLLFSKLVVTPFVSRELNHVLRIGSTEAESRDFRNFAFLYGMLPSGSSVFVHATRYGLPDSAISTTVVGGTLISAVFLSITALIASIPHWEQHHLLDSMVSTIVASGAVGVIFSVLTIVALIRRRKKDMLCGAILYMAVCQLITAIGGVLISVDDSPNAPSIVTGLRSTMATAGIFVASTWTATVAILRAAPCYKSSFLALRISATIHVGIMTSTFVFLLLKTDVEHGGSVIGSLHPKFEFGGPLDMTTFIVISTCLLVTVVGIVKHHRSCFATTAYPIKDNENVEETYPDIVKPALQGSPSWSEELPQKTEHITSPLRLDESSKKSRGVVVNDEVVLSGNVNLSTIQAKNDIDKIPCRLRLAHERHPVGEETVQITATHEEDHDEALYIGRTYSPKSSPFEAFHVTVLLLIISACMVVTAGVSFWRIMPSEVHSGILVEVEFVNTALTFGQGAITFVVVVLDMRWVKHACSRSSTCFKS